MKTFVYAAVAATIAASSAMAADMSSQAALWEGPIAADTFEDECVFFDNSNGVMEYDVGTDTWTTTRRARVSLNQRGAILVKVIADDYVVQVDEDGAAVFAYDATVDYNPGRGVDATRVMGMYAADANAGMVGNVEVNLTGDLKVTTAPSTGTERLRLVGADLAKGLPKQMEWRLGGTVEMTNDNQLLDDDAQYRLGHTVTCVK